MRKHTQQQAGFTLLELIVVIISLLIIGAIIFFIGS
jgi:prepilin-type N-terminal cleavage/methylation domain-containing protein